MTILDVLRPKTEDKPDVIPQQVSTRLSRGREEMSRNATKRRLCKKFLRSETYAYINDRGFLDFQATAPFAIPGQGKPPHRIRNTYNFIKPIVMGKVSAASQRIPSYEVLPTTTDPSAIGARLAEKVAQYGYDKWNLRHVTVKTMTLAIGGGGEGFAMPYFDPNVGPYLTLPPDPATGQPSGEPIGQGEIKVLVLDGNQVYWEPGVDFYDSRWHAIERARPIEDVMEMPGFFGEKLTPDASSADVPTDAARIGNLVLTTEYYERPCPKYPDGRRMVMANGRRIVDNRRINRDALTSWEPYPLITRDGSVLDEPVLHRLQWSIDIDEHRDLGLTWELIDPQRTIQDIWNKLLEMKNRALNARMIAPRGAQLTAAVDEPGALIEYTPAGNGDFNIPKFEDVSNAIAIAQPLMNMLDKMQADMRELGLDTQLSADANVAARTVSAVIEQYQAKWQSFLGDSAVWHSRVMRHCLLLVSRHYSEARQLAIRGRFGPETIQDFDGAQLLDQLNVRVLPGSLEYLTRDQITQRVTFYADRHWITPQQAMVAISSGTADVLVQSLELDIARIDRIIQKINDGTVMEMPTRLETVTDPNTGQESQEEVPGWMPMDMVDDLGVWRARLGDFLKTDTFGRLEREQQEVAKLILSGIDRLQRQQAQRAVEQQTAQAEQLGLDNAAKPQGAKPLPDQSQLAAEPATV